MHCKWIIVKITNVSKIRQPKISVKHSFTLILGCLLNLVNKSVSRETSMLAANRLTQIGNERISAVCRHFLCAIFHCRETVCCLPSFTGHLLVCLPHFGLRPVRLDRLCICPLQCRQQQQNISLGCVHKAGQR